MNRILFLTSVTFSHMGGMEIYNDQLAAALGSQLRGQVYMLPVDDPIPMKTAGANYQLVSMALLHQLPSINLRRRLLHRCAQWQASRIIRRHGVDFILCGYVHLLPMVAELSRLHHIPYAAIGHGIEVWGALTAAKLAALRQADQCLSVSQFTAGHMIQKGVLPAKIRILPPHVDTQYFRIEADRGADLRQKMGWANRTVLLTLGRLASDEQYKGHDKVMRALRSVVRIRPDLLYVIAGDGNDASRLRALASEWGLQDHVRFVGYLPEQDKVIFYNACDVFIMVSQTGQVGNRWVGEGFGIVFLEAGACGKPVIGPMAGGAPDAIQDGITGILVPPEDVQAIGEAILTLARDPALRRRLGAQGRQRAEYKFSLKGLRQQVENWLHERSERTLPV